MSTRRGKKEIKSKERKKRIQVNPSEITVLMARDANLQGSLREWTFPDQPTGHPKAFWIENWKSLNDSLEWTVEIPEAGEYKVAMVASGKDSEIEIVSHNNKIISWINNGWDRQWNRWWDKEWKPSSDLIYSDLIYTGWDRIPVGTLYLPLGVSTITMRATKIGSRLGLFSLELVQPAVEKILVEKAKKLRSSTKWLADAKYGVMFTWGPWTYPRRGERKPFPKNINDFDVNAFVNMVEETGAGYVIFCTTWVDHYFPAPIRAIEKILSGRTSKRDLITEIADSLGKQGIKLMLYYHCGHGDPEWWKRTGFNEDKITFIDNWCAIVSEVGQRYGRKVVGWFLDDNCILYPLSAPFERMAMAAKSGNSERIICYNDWMWPKLTDFQDYFSGEGDNWISEESHLRYLSKGGSGIFVDGRRSGLQAHLSFTLEENSAWGHTAPNTDIAPPSHKKKDFIKMIKSCIERKNVPSINLEVYEDGTPSPRSLELMRALRKAIRGT